MVCARLAYSQCCELPGWSYQVGWFLRVILRVFGFTVLEFMVGFGESESEEKPEFAGGGQSGSIERDMTPLNPDDRYDWEFIDKRFGFHD